jgi:hypothetical protein
MNKQERNAHRRLRRLINAHAEYAGQQGIEFYNLGWYTEENAICSKTSHGMLETRRANRRITHQIS